MINEEYKEAIKSQYEKMKAEGKIEEFVDFPLLKKAKIFINSKPKHVFTQFAFDSDTVYLGTESMDLTTPTE